MPGKARQRIGMTAALLTPVFMGLSPVFGKLALRTGLDAYTLAAFRTCLAAALLWAFFLIFSRRHVYIFPAGILFTLVVGAVNGLGSLLFYNGLLLLDNASMVQLLQMTYVIFAMLLMRIAGDRISRLSVLRAGLALLAVYVITVGAAEVGSIQWIGAGVMLVSALLYALHVVLSQRVMFEMPAPTMALYSLSWMGLTVLIARLIYGSFLPLPLTPALPIGWLWLAGLTVVTALSRVTLFSGVRNLGVLQTILLNVAEIAVTLLAGFVWLSERMTPLQWIGIVILVVSVFLSRFEGDVRDDVYRPLPHPARMGNLPPHIRKELEGILGPAASVAPAEDAPQGD
jgi:drug/metabolite transporter (DMT)-like permease